MTPQELWMMLSDEGVLAQRRFGIVPGEPRPSMRQLNMKEVEIVSLQIVRIVQDRLGPQTALEMCRELEDTPIKRLYDALFHEKEQDAECLELWHELRQSGTDSDKEYAPPSTPEQPKNMEDLALIERGWEIVDMAKASGGIFEKIQARALEIALCGHFSGRSQGMGSAGR